MGQAKSHFSEWCSDSGDRQGRCQGPPIKVRRDHDPWHDVPPPRNLDRPEKEVPLETDEADEHLGEDILQKDDAADYVCDFQAFMAKVGSGALSALNVSFENASQVLELSTPACSVTPLLIDYGLEASAAFDINMTIDVDKFARRLRVMRPSIVLFNLLGVDKKSMRSRWRTIADELKDYEGHRFILVILDSMTAPVLSEATRNMLKELKNVEEHIFHPGGNSNHYCSMLTNLPTSYAKHPLSQTSDRAKNRLAAFAVKLREAFKAHLSEKD